MKNLRICKAGHRYYKSSDCPVCPECEKLKKPEDGLFALLPAPARRALQNAGIINVQILSGYSEKEILSLHGLGPSSVPILKKALQKEKLRFRKD